MSTYLVTKNGEFVKAIEGVLIIGNTHNYIETGTATESFLKSEYEIIQYDEESIIKDSEELFKIEEERKKEEDEFQKILTLSAQEALLNAQFQKDIENAMIQSKLESENSLNNLKRIVPRQEWFMLEKTNICWYIVIRELLYRLNRKNELIINKYQLGIFKVVNFKLGKKMSVDLLNYILVDLGICVRYVNHDRNSMFKDYLGDTKLNSVPGCYIDHTFNAVMKHYELKDSR